MYILIEYVALFMQHTMRMRHIVICGLSDPTVFFSTSQKGHDFRKTLLKMKHAF
jgi:hypothetical protein